jgi:hypothetical protein
VGFPSVSGAPGSNGGIYAVPAVGVSGIGNEETFPLDVIEYGGLQVRTVSPANATTGVILPAPTSPNAWRLHSWGCVPAVASGGWGASLSDSSGNLFDALLVATVAGVMAFGKYLGGQLATTSVIVDNGTGATMTFWVRYDEVLTPVIT